MKPAQFALLCAVMSAVCGCAAAPGRAGNEALRQQVFAAERAFAKTMADRDHAAFTAMLAEDTIWFGSQGPLRGSAEVAAAWKKFYEGPAAPFSWEPTEVEVLASGTLAHSAGPVRDPQGKVVSSYNSVWRLEAPGVWRIVFDKGCNVCSECTATAGAAP